LIGSTDSCHLNVLPGEQLHFLNTVADQHRSINLVLNTTYFFVLTSAL